MIASSASCNSSERVEGSAGDPATPFVEDGSSTLLRVCRGVLKGRGESRSGRGGIERGKDVGRYVREAGWSCKGGREGKRKGNKGRVTWEG